MTTKDAIEWFKHTFGQEIESVIGGTPFGLDLIVAIACQETGYLWRKLIGTLEPGEILKLCVGDTFDAPNRDAFPRTKAELTNFTRGQETFEIAREALEAIARYDDTYAKVARNNPNKFCHGFGLFQYDIQFFKADPEFFLERNWYDLKECTTKFVLELKEAMRRQGWAGKTTLSDTEKVYVAIAYNHGSANLKQGFKQGFKSDDGRYYGESVFEYLRIAQTITLGAPAPAKVAAPSVKTAAPLPPPTPVEATDDIYQVDVRESTLRLRSEPKIDKRDPRANVIAQLPAGQMVVRISGKKGDEFFEVETSLNGAHFRGFAAAEYLRPVKVPKAIPVVE